MINEEQEIEKPQIIDAGTGGNKLTDVIKPRRYESTPNREWYEVSIPRERLENWFGTIPITMKLENITLKNDEEELQFPDQEVERSSSDAPYHIPVSPKKFRYMFYCSGNRMKKELGKTLCEDKASTTVDSIKFKVKEWSSDNE